MRIETAKRERIVAALRVPGAKLAKVAREFGVSPSAVKVIRAEAGLAPLPSVAAKENAAAARDYMLVAAKRLRADLNLRALKEAALFLDALHQPAIVYAFGRNADGEHAYVEQRVDEPDAKGKQALIISFAVAVDKATMLERYDQESSGAAKAAIMELVDRLALPAEEAAV